MKLDLVSSAVASSLAAACLVFVACPRNPEPPPAPEVVAGHTQPQTQTGQQPPGTGNGAADGTADNTPGGEDKGKGTGKKVPAVHREKAEECSHEKVAGNVEARGAQGDVPDSYRPTREPKCAKDADCTAGKNGRCSMVGGGRLPPYAACVYDACYVDADCGAKSECECRGSAQAGHSCMQGNCAVDADCGDKSGGAGYCSPSLGSCGNYGGVVGNFCHTSNDECVSDDECMGKAGGYCAYSQEAGKWQCSYGHCVG